MSLELAGHLVFTEIDSCRGHQQLQQFTPPSMIINSGTPGHVHAYWSLQTTINVADLERANRRLAHHLGGDMASVDAARILRPPSLNHKHKPPAPVRLVSLDTSRRYDINELVGPLPDPPHQPAAPSQPARPRQWTPPLDQALRAVPAVDYVRALTGREPNQAGRIQCPFHDDHTPSLQLYPDGTWCCFGCRTGGTIYDFAATLWQTGTKNREFLKLRDRLTAELQIDTGRGRRAIRGRQPTTDRQPPER